LDLKECEFLSSLIFMLRISRPSADFAGYRMIIVAAFALNIAHPGPVFAGQMKRTTAFADAEVQAVHAEAK